LNKFKKKVNIIGFLRNTKAETLIFSLNPPLCQTAVLVAQLKNK